MTRPRKAASILDAKGAFKKNPQRKRKDVEGVGVIGKPPDEFSELEKELWVRIQAMVPPGVVVGSDELLMEALARWWAKLRQTKTEDITAAQIGQIINGCNSLCMSPQSRTKISMPETKKKNPFEGF